MGAEGRVRPPDGGGGEFAADVAARLLAVLDACRDACVALSGGERLTWLLGPRGGWFVPCRESERAILSLCSRALASGSCQEQAIQGAFVRVVPCLGSLEGSDWASFAVAVLVPRQEPLAGSAAASRLPRSDWHKVALFLPMVVALVAGARPLSADLLSGRRGWLRGWEEERARIGRDVHDELAQVLAGVFARVQALERLLPEQAAARREVALLKDMVHEAVVATSCLAYELRPPVLSQGLWVALRYFLGQWSRDNEVTVRSHLEGDDSGLSPEVQIAVFRVVQEACNNVRRHARARNVAVQVCTAPDGVRGRVEDDGVGFDAAAGPRPGQFGLLGMRERAELAGGWLQVDSRPGEGTVVSFWMPAEG